MKYWKYVFVVLFLVFSNRAHADSNFTFTGAINVNSDDNLCNSVLDAIPDALEELGYAIINPSCTWSENVKNLGTLQLSFVGTAPNLQQGKNFKLVTSYTPDMIRQSFIALMYGKKIVVRVFYDSNIVKSKKRLDRE